MKKTHLILGSVIILILLGLGCSFSYFLGKKEIGENKEICPFIGLLSSKIINGFVTTASGEVTQISGRDLTLSKEGGTLTIPMGEDALIYQTVPPEEVEGVPQPAVREEITLEEIKVGDKVSISCQLKNDGTLEGIEVMVSP